MYNLQLGVLLELCSVVFSVESFSAVLRISDNGLQYFSEAHKGVYLYYTAFNIIFCISYQNFIIHSVFKKSYRKPKQENINT